MSVITTPHIFGPWYEMLTLSWQMLLKNCIVQDQNLTPCNTPKSIFTGVLSVGI